MHRLKVFVGVLGLALLPAGAFAQADFTRYVAFGDSLTAGFSSGSIVRTFQSNSYPALLRRQATGSATGFEQPLVSTPGLPPILGLQRLVPSPVIGATAAAPGQPQNLTLPRPYDNLAVPGATVVDLVNKRQSTSATDPTDLILRRLGFTQLEQGLSLRPTFATLWIGNNDALAAATSGRVIEDVTLTSLARFQANYLAAARAIRASGARLAIANIPNVTSIPFVTTLSRTVVVGGQTVTLNGPNGPLAAGDFVLLTASAELAQGRGLPGQPALSDSVVLNAAEAAAINARIAQYNSVIAAAVNETQAAFVDSNEILRQASTTGIHVGGLTFTSAFLTGGIFSYDGVHPNAFGYAYIANEFIKAINRTYNDDIPPVDLRPFMFGTQSTGVAANLVVAEPTAVSLPFVFTREAAQNLYKSLGIPSWVTDGAPPPTTVKPRRTRGRG